MTTPRVYVKLKAEMKAALDEGMVSSPIQMEQALKLPYLQAVVYEGLRSKYKRESLFFNFLIPPEALRGSALSFTD